MAESPLIMSARAIYRDLTEELLEAHLDTIGLALAPTPAEDLARHVEYLQALYRRGHGLIAASEINSGEPTASPKRKVP